jgi:hypothetical protein
MRRFLRWETAGTGLDGGWLELAASASGDVRRSRVVIARQPPEDAVRACKVTVRVLLGERSRAHDLRAGSRSAQPGCCLRRTWRCCRVPPHHSLPTEHGDVLAGELLRCVWGPGAG